ncbi:hypothetical protein F4561_002030 [Lipingzhangella halophila]|uniref:UGSC-like domain-containing protein n=1 Tax=Lipingzhangella halophila TaxID=1783352 RepID=A0A7W7RFW4_9ACTN|nr:UGSC family (seleno)protein [Lipingzhangella halophila]MBB4931210.1 hypothetical protein [Lipingzhangella halophila]
MSLSFTRTFLDPTGGQGGTGTATASAPRPAELRGAVVGLLENTKHNAALLLDDLGEMLIRDYGASRVVRRTKHAFALPVSEELLHEFTAECDVVVTGVGDCGSCSASAVADGIAFENAGIPAAVICSDAFAVTADAMAELRGSPGYAYHTTAHPVAVLEPKQVAERARELLAPVAAGLTGEER